MNLQVGFKESFIRKLKSFSEAMGSGASRPPSEKCPSMHALLSRDLGLRGLWVLAFRLWSLGFHVEAMSS